MAVEPTILGDASDGSTKFTLCVFCGSSSGTSPKYQKAAEDFAYIMYMNSWSLVYGGGARGLMGTLAKNLVRLAGPGSVHGIIPEALLQTERGVVRPEEAEYGRTTVVRTMHERKAIMVKEANAFLALPGGYGTMEELFETITWNQLGIHGNPIIAFNIDGFFDEVFSWLKKATTEGFVSEGQIGILCAARTGAEVVEKINLYKPAVGRFALNWTEQA